MIKFIFLHLDIVKENLSKCGKYLYEKMYFFTNHSETMSNLVNPFHANVPFLYPLQILENQRFPNISSEY